MTALRALAAVIARNLRIARRRPELLVQTMAVPVVVVGLASVIFGAGDAWPVAVVDEADSPASHRVVQALDDTRGATGPYFRVLTTDAADAAALLADGRLHLVLTIPAAYDDTGVVELETYNITTDAMKNVRLRVTTTANLVDGAQDAARVTAVIDKARPDDVTRTAFMGGSAVVLALLLGAALVAANLYAVDAEHRTTKEIALTPLGSHLAGLGAATAGWLLAVVVAVPALLLALTLGTRADASGLVGAAVLLLPAAAAAAGVGVGVAVALRTHRLIQPTLILLALGSYFAAGGFIPVSALPPLARTVDRWWAPSYVFEWVNPVLHGFADRPTPTAVTAVLTAAVLGTALAGLAAHRAAAHAHTPGQ